MTAQTSRAFEILNPASGRCLNLSGAGPWANSTPIIAYDCTLGADNEKFRLTSDGQLRNPVSGRCLNVSGAGPVWDNGTPIILFDCVAGAANERFKWTADGQLRNPASGRCVNLSGGGPTWPNSTPIILWDCKGDPNEQFRVVSDDQIPSAVGQLKNQASGRCLNVSGTGPTWDNNTPIILFDCKGDNNEQFRLTSDGQLFNFSSGRCLNVKGAGPTWDNNTPIVLFDCVAGAPNEKFEWTADGQLRNPASGRCLNVSGAGPVWNNGNPDHPVRLQGRPQRAIPAGVRQVLTPPAPPEPGQHPPHGRWALSRLFRVLVPTA
ncbi:ricin-type beta-trefoil lectin domain protein [Kitasatospora griseola]|uniref:ricin-type beta-trefoil lectin domain protein n=1 Tax=Kitasatospora griseola TaxID=2064 RepID=UPI00382FC7DE